MEDFDSRALTWDSEQRRVDMTRDIAAAIRKHIPLSRNMTALEYGCGTGLLSFNLHSSLKDLKMVDISDGMLDVLREKVKTHNLPNVKIEKLDLTANFEPQGLYDLICTQMTLHHIVDVEKLLVVFYQMLNPSGYLCIADLDEEDGTFHAPDFQGYYGFNQKELSALLKEIGFGKIRNEIVFGITKTAHDGVIKTFPVFLMSAQKESS